MRKILLIAILFVSFAAKAQTPNVVSNPMTGHYYRFYGFAELDSGLIMGKRDTFWTPKKPMIIFDSTTFLMAYYNGIRWTEFGGVATTPNIKAVLDVGHNAGGDSLTNAIIDGTQNTIVNIGNSSIISPYTIFANSYGFTWNTSTVPLGSTATGVIDSTKWLTFYQGSLRRKIADTTGYGGYTTTRYQRYVDSLLFGGEIAAAGTVTSVALSLPSMFTVSGSPVTSTGTLTAVLANQSAYSIFARGSGSGVPSFVASLDSNWIPTLHSLGYYNLQYQPLENQRLSTTNNVGFNTLNLATQSSTPSTPSSGILIYANSVNALSWIKSDGFQRSIRFPFAGNEILTAESKSAYTLADSADVVNSGVIATNNTGYYLNAFKIFTRLNTDSILEGTVDSFYKTSRVQSVIIGDTSSLLVSKTFLTARNYITLTSLSVTTTGTGAASYNNSTGVFNIPNITGFNWSVTGNSLLSRTTNFIGSTDTSRLYFGTKNIRTDFIDSSQRWVFGDTAASSQVKMDIVGVVKIGANFNTPVTYLAGTSLVTNGIGCFAGGINLEGPTNTQFFDGIQNSGGGGGVNITTFGQLNSTFAFIQGGINAGDCWKVNGVNSAGVGAGRVNVINLSLSISPSASNTVYYNGADMTPTFNGTVSLFTIAGITGYHVATQAFSNGSPQLVAFACNNTVGRGFVDSSALITNNFVGATAFGTLSTPNASALIDMESTTLGFLSSQMTTTQWTAIASKKEGLEGWDLTTHRKVWYNGTNSQEGEFGNYTIFTPVTGGKQTLVNNQNNIINPAGSIALDTLVLPTSPNDKDQMTVTFEQPITLVVYTNGTTAGAITAPAAGSQKKWTYSSATTTWYVIFTLHTFHIFNNFKFIHL